MLGTATDPADPPATDMAPEVLEALVGKMHAIPHSETKRNCVIVGIGGPSGVGKTTLSCQLLGTYK